MLKEFHNCEALFFSMWVDEAVEDKLENKLPDDKNPCGMIIKVESIYIE